MFELHEEDFWIRRGAQAEWLPTGHPLVPLAARVPAREGPISLRESWILELGDFPDEPLYALYVDGARVGHFNDWPSRWPPREEAGAFGRAALPRSVSALEGVDPHGPEPWPHPSRHAEHLHAIAAAPDDDRPRARYSDWLERQGQPFRAAFLRLESGLPYDSERTDYVHPMLSHYADERWQGRPPVWCWWQVDDFVRGFVERLWLTGHDVAFLPEYLGSPYLLPRHVRLENHELHGRTAAALRSPMLAATRSLRLSYMRVLADAVDALVESPHLDGLEALVIDHGYVADDQLQRLTKRFSPRLHHLPLGWFRVQTLRGGSSRTLDFHDYDEAVGYADDTASERDELPFAEAVVRDSRLELVEAGVHYGYRARLRAREGVERRPPPPVAPVARQSGPEVPADGWAFRCELSPGEALATLRGLPLGWDWHLVDDEPPWRKLIISRTDGVGTWLTIFANTPRYLLEVMAPSSLTPHAMRPADVVSTLQGLVLPALGAADVRRM